MNYPQSERGLTIHPKDWSEADIRAFVREFNRNRSRIVHNHREREVRRGPAGRIGNVVNVALRIVGVTPLPALAKLAIKRGSP